MSRMFQSLYLFVLSCFCLTLESHQGQILPPQNLSLLWINGFEPQLSWAPPQQSVENCKYVGVLKTTKIDSKQTYNTTCMSCLSIDSSLTSMTNDNNVSSPWQLYTLMEGGFLQLSVQTVCNGTRSSKPAVITRTYPELVRNLQCYVHSAKQAHCSWQPASNAQDLRFFYRLIDENFMGSAEDNPRPLHIQECSSYSYTGGTRTGCDLEANINHAIHILFNGTLNNMFARNSFKKDPIDVRPPPLNWTVTKTGGKFNISWTYPDIKASWTITINYTECNDVKIEQIKDEKTSTVVEMVSHCPYRMAIKAQTWGGETPWSDEKYFDADADPNALLYAAIIIPLMFAGVAVLIFVCCRKNKENLFPKVPEPRDLLSDISDNNNKCTVRDLYIPAEEEENCKISLVVDPQINKVDF